jgi:hypothetical protein
MRRAVTVFCVLLWPLFFVKGQDASQLPLLRQSDLEQTYFSSISNPGNSLLVVFKSSGGRCLIERPGKEPVVSNYNEKLLIGPNETVDLNFKGATVSFSPLPGPMNSRGFLVEETSGERRPGATPAKRAATVLLVKAEDGTPMLEFLEPNATAAEIENKFKKNESTLASITPMPQIGSSAPAATAQTSNSSLKGADHGGPRTFPFIVAIVGVCAIVALFWFLKKR